MKKHIAEELPKRKHPVAVVDKDEKDEKEPGESSEKRVRQAVYDIRYRSRREDVDLKQAFSQYMQNSSMAANERTLVKQKLFGKSLGEEYGMPDAASGTLAKAMYKVFVEGVSYEQDLAALYEEEIKASPDTKYKVKVTDKNSGRSYVRFATREKINQLRLNPNISDVSLLDPRDTREPYEGERSRGAATAAVKAGKDWDGDGKKESPAKEYRGVVHNAIQKKTGGTPDGKDTSSVKEEFIGEVSENKDTNKKLDVMKKGKKNKVKVFPTDGEATKSTMGTISASYENDGSILSEKAVSKAQQRFMGMVYATKKGAPAPSPEVAAAAKGITGKEAKKFAKTPHDKLPEKVDTKEETKVEYKDTRDLPTKINLIKNKMRAMGAKNPVVMVASEENVEEAAPLAVGAGLAAAAAAPYLLKKFAKPAVDKAIDNARKNSKIGGDRRVPQMNSYELEGEVVSEEESDRMRDREQEERGMDRPSRYAGGRNPNRSSEPPVGSQRRRKRRSSAPSAMDIVRASIEKKYGKGSLM